MFTPIDIARRLLFIVDLTWLSVRHTLGLRPRGRRARRTPPLSSVVVMLAIVYALVLALALANGTTTDYRTELPAPTTTTTQTTTPTAAPTSGVPRHVSPTATAAPDHVTHVIDVTKPPRKPRC